MTMADIDTLNTVGSGQAPLDNVSPLNHDNLEPKSDGETLPLLHTPSSATSAIFPPPPALPHRQPLTTAPPSFHQSRYPGPRREVSPYLPPASRITEGEISPAPSRYTRIDGAPWPVRLSKTRASATGARWEGRLDGGTVGGFGQLPGRRLVPLSGTDAARVAHGELDGEGGERNYYSQYGTVWGREVGERGDRFERIAAPAGLARAAAGCRGREGGDDEVQGEGRSGSRHRSEGTSERISGVRFVESSLPMSGEEWRRRHRWRGLCSGLVREMHREEGERFRKRATPGPSWVEQKTETEKRERETVQKETVPTDLADGDDLVERSNWLGW